LAIETIPSAEVVGWLEEFMAGPHSTQDRAEVAWISSGLEDPRALALLERAVSSSEVQLRGVAAKSIVARAEWDPTAVPLAEQVRQVPEFASWIHELSDEAAGDGCSETGGT
jgi:hypothetical protein